MYDTGDTICALSSTVVAGNMLGKSIIRISGSDAIAVAGEVFCPDEQLRRRGTTAGMIAVADIEIDATLYAFSSPQSYTGQDLIELHFFAAACVVELVMAELLAFARQAGPGEFTLRAYLNGRIDLSQAEAVAEIVAGSNAFQLQAAQKLLAGKLSQTAAKIREEILDVLSLIEAGLDFSTEGITFLGQDEATETIGRITQALKTLLGGSIRYEEMIDLPSVGLAGASNAGKSSLLNALLGQERSIVSDQKATTRDVLCGVLELEKCRCTLFDCAGMGRAETDSGLLDELAAQTAAEAIKAANMVLLCVDLAKTDFSEDIEISRTIHDGELVLVATKADLLDEQDSKRKSAQLTELFDSQPVLTSTRSGRGIDSLRALIDSRIVRLTAGAAEAADRIAINQRHRKVVAETIEHLIAAAGQITLGNDEIAAMFLRSAYEVLAGLEKEYIDEAVLERIFSNFCIGK
ncbi:MAG: 50S ribosome-binding GTPase [Planctomycetes bacterium]|nr:50S ribosome-binding GTPase [Planctomycetota bacterium]